MSGVMYEAEWWETEVEWSGVGHVSFRVHIGRGVHGAVQYSFRSLLALHFVVWFSQNHNRSARHFCSHMCGAVFKMRYNDIKPIYFLNSGLFLPNPKLLFPLFWAKF